MLPAIRANNQTTVDFINNLKNTVMKVTNVNVKVDTETMLVAKKTIEENKLSCSLREFIEYAIFVMNRNWDNNYSCTGNDILVETKNHFKK